MLRDEDRRVHATLLHDLHHAFEVLASASAQGELQGFPGHATTDGKLRDLDAVDVVIQRHGVCFSAHVVCCLAGFGAVHGFEGFQLAVLGVEVGTVVHDVRDDAGAVLHHVDGLRKGEVIAAADEDLIRALRLCLREDVVYDGRAGGICERMHALWKRTMQVAVVQHFDVTA